ncbi:MAG: hypothetical protein ABIQ97_03525 [Lysobacteraceae bacterium]
MEGLAGHESDWLIDGLKHANQMIARTFFCGPPNLQNFRKLLVEESATNC